MNDPLRDNRIFPEEMHEQPPVLTKKQPHFSWAWFLVVAIIIIILVSVGYFYANKNTTTVINQSEYEKQVEIADFVKQQTPDISEGERDQKIEILFGN